MGVATIVIISSSPFPTSATALRDACQPAFSTVPNKKLTNNVAPQAALCYTCPRFFSSERGTPQPRGFVNTETVLKIIFEVLGGLGIFLLGIKNMSEGMQAVAGEGLRKMISSVTNNRFMACGMGTLVTCLVQSSSVTTVMVVGLVNSGFMTLAQAIGVIMGANIGTTITGWILVLKIGKYGLPLLGAMALVYLFSRRDKLRYTAMAVMGVGMIFFGLELMSRGFAPLNKMPEFEALFAVFQADSYWGILKCVMAGCGLTMIVQSSSATLGITIGLAEAGMIPFPTAAALVLGENVGTTITALLASLGATTNARRAALSHTIFNLLGSAWIVPLFPLYILFIYRIMGVAPETGVDREHMRQGVALVHSIFNVANTLLFLPLLPLLAQTVRRILPDRKVKEVPHLSYLNVRMLDMPAMAVQQSKDEILRMAESVEKMLVWLRPAYAEQEPDRERNARLFRREEILDVIQKEIVEFLSQMVSGTVPREITREARRQLRMADEYESVSDYLENLLKLKLKLTESGLKISDDGLRQILDLHDHVESFLREINVAVKAGDPIDMAEYRANAEAVTHLMKNYRDRHLERVQSQQVSPMKSLIYMDMLNAYRKIRDHALNIAETLPTQ
jgi:phosphate:Na+ symporter